ncbi:1-deoxy-D-xylulose-5-phosphate synthase [Helicobacter didelphidarum]|uniref:1-deoxy-D-xylulose-5-phosphate synthase n=1 Tax=Helicobacter didelphidarum TaxID=2040648 RepID=A0A3D8ILY4_9HELI|nr:1-deoxy-D-xylulose-5-phosphate synthase [Helicobacter didelphidarum]RDU65965.1 1-deoxy-D-xylulose-5-phosphate synthase [Helicobacter didelphidarum]
MQQQASNAISHTSHIENASLESHTIGNCTHSNIVSLLKAGENIQPYIQSAPLTDLVEISDIIRQRILEVVSKNGGHLSSTLGAVELIVGMHTVFDCKLNPFIYDVSHQAYAHKLLTGRYNDFSSLRQFGGISGFCAPYESSFDYFIAGHSSTSLSLGAGVAKAKTLKKEQYKPIVMIGDGSMSAGLVYEALNEIGDLKLPMVIVLNDNEMSIAKPIGAISKILSKTIASPLYQTMKERVKKIVNKMPDGTAFIAKRFEESFKLITPGLLFEEFGIDYIGPINGNDLEEVIRTFKSVQNLNRPVLIHCQTIKGKGYQIAEGKYEKWHGVAPFDLVSGKPLHIPTIKNPTSVFSNKLLEMARKDSRIIGVTAAMPSGTGLDKLMDEFPDRFFDVAIAEQHAVTSMAAMAKEGFKPFIAIYSTFLQRAFDQIIHDVSIMNLPVTFCIDRAGIVGEDGETHQGLFDIAYLRTIPNIHLISPRDSITLESLLEFAIDFPYPLAIRYPRGKFLCDVFIKDSQNVCQDNSDDLLQQDYKNLHDVLVKEIQKNTLSYNKHLQMRKAQMLTANVWENFKPNSMTKPNKKENKILIIGYGNGVGRGLFLVEYIYNEHNIACDLLDLISLKPLDSETLARVFVSYEYIFVLSDNYRINGVGSSLIELATFLLSQNKIVTMPKIISFEIEDKFIKHGKTEKVEESLGLNTECLTKVIMEYIHK